MKTRANSSGAVSTGNKENVTKPVTSSKSKATKKNNQKAVVYPTGRAMYKEEYKRTHPNVSTSEFSDIWKALDDSTKKVCLLLYQSQSYSNHPIGVE